MGKENTLESASNTGAFNLSDDLLVTYGGAIKALDNGLYGGYLVRFTNTHKRDATGDYFDTETNFLEDEYPFVGKAIYDHARDKDIGAFPIAEIVSAEKRTDGIYTECRIDFAKRYTESIKALNEPEAWKERQIELSTHYENIIKTLIEDGRLGWSSGALPFGVRKDNGHIKTWPIVDRSLTYAPAMPFETVVSSVKSLVTYGLRELLTEVREDNGASLNNSIKANTSEVIKPMDGMTLDSAMEMIKKYLIPLFAVYRELMGGGDTSALEDDAAKDAMAELPEDQMKSMTVEKLQTIAQASAKKIIENHAQKAVESELAVKSFITDAVANGKHQAQVNQEGRSKVPGFSPNSDKESIKRFNINLGVEPPTMIDTIKAMLPGATEADRRKSGFVSHGNEYADAIKAQNPFIGPLGGNLVVQELRDQILDPLRPEVIAFDLGVQQTSANGAGSVIIPKMTVAPTAFRPGMNTQITPSNATFNTVTAFMRPIASVSVIPLQQLQTALPSMEAKIREQMVKSIALQIDKEIFIGTGNVVSPDTGAGIRGILSLATTQTSLNAAGRKPGYQDLVNAVTALAEQNVPEDNTMGWAMHPRTRGTFWGMTDNVGQPLWRADVSKLPYPTMVGYKSDVTTQIPINVATTDASRSDSSYIFYGRWDLAEYIMSQDLAVFVDPYTLSDYLQVRVIAYTFSDFVVHFPEAFVAISGVVA